MANTETGTEISSNQYGYNQNRIITLVRRGGGDGFSWKNGLSSLLGNRQNASQKITNWSDLDVDDDVDLLLEESYPEFTIDNQYSTPLSDFIGNLLGDKAKTVSTVAGVASAAINAIKGGNTSGTTSGSFNPWTLGIPAWETDGVEGINFTYTFKFTMGQYGLWNARKEVVKPILNLMAPTLPQYLDAFTISGPQPNVWNLLSNLTANLTTSVVNWIKGNSSEDESSTTESTTTTENSAEDSGGFWNSLSNVYNSIGTVMEKVLLDTYRDYTYTIKFGNFLTINNAIIKGSTVNFSNKVDQDGYPVAGSCKLNFKTVVPISLASSSEDNMAMRFGG